MFVFLNVRVDRRIRKGIFRRGCDIRVSVAERTERPGRCLGRPGQGCNGSIRNTGSVAETAHCGRAATPDKWVSSHVFGRARPFPLVPLSRTHFFPTAAPIAGSGGGIPANTRSWNCPDLPAAQAVLESPAAQPLPGTTLVPHARSPDRIGNPNRAREPEERTRSQHACAPPSQPDPPPDPYPPDPCATGAPRPLSRHLVVRRRRLSGRAGHLHHLQDRRSLERRPGEVPRHPRGPSEPGRRGAGP